MPPAANPNPDRAANPNPDKLVYCHENMHVQERMQDAGWGPDVGRAVGVSCYLGLALEGLPVS